MEAHDSPRFLELFDNLENDDDKDRKQNALLRHWLEHHRVALFKELRDKRPILKFWSYHPGNPNLESKEEKRPGEALLLSGWTEVKPALEKLSMKPYARTPIKEDCQFILSMDDKVSHEVKNKALTEALKDPFLQRKIDESVNEAWSSFAGYSSADDEAIDIHQFARNVALRFTGKFFGIPEKYIFEGYENLEKWSLLAFENFIWKIHGRHFGDPEPELHGALLKISGLVRNISIKLEGIAKTRGTEDIPSSVIFRLAAQQEHFTEELDILHNIVGAIQGLVDNVATSISYSFNWFLQNSTRLEEAKSAKYSEESLRELILEAHQNEPPAPFLPRRGKFSDLEISSDKLGDIDPKAEHHFCCAIGSAITDLLSKDPTAVEWDIRMGSGMHACIGKYIGDKVTAAAISQLLSLDSFEIVSPLTLRWGWVVQSFRVKSKRKSSYSAIDFYTSTTKHRPHPLSTWSEKSVLPPNKEDSEKIKSEQANYTSWPSLTDQSFFKRHLSCFESDRSDWKNVDKAFQIQTNQESSKNTTVLFSFFAQWLTDSFLRTNPDDKRRTDSNHQIDMCQLYGLNRKTTDCLRSNVDGKLFSQLGPDGKEILPSLYKIENEKLVIADHFRKLPYIDDKFIEIAEKESYSDRHYFATGLKHGNIHIGYTALSCLFLRAHNKICDQLKAGETSHIEDERIFQTARLIVIALELKIIIEEYINHISSPSQGKKTFVFDNSFAELQAWYRPNWISLEFDLLYRWHCLMPDIFELNKKSYSYENHDNEKPGLTKDNTLLIENGIEAILEAASKQAAGQAGLFNTPHFLYNADKNALKMARDLKIRSYNDYRECFSLRRISKFEELTTDDKKLTFLKDAYNEDIDKVELLIGLYAEEPKPDKLFGNLMTRMVAYDAFSHALTNPLLSKNVWNKETFTKTGMEIIDKIHSLDDLLKWVNSDSSPHTALTFKLKM